MTKDELKVLLQEKYNRENWREIIRSIFPNVTFLLEPQPIPIGEDGKESNVKTFVQFGNARLADGKNLALFEVIVKGNVQISRNRVNLRKLVSKYIDEGSTNGVLSIFSSDSDDYRFSFVAKESVFSEETGFETKETNTKRFTYVLGPQESCTTAADRFYKLIAESDSVDLDKVLEAFSVERLTKEFFKKYKEFYEDFVQFITGKRYVKKGNKWEQKTISEPHEYLSTVFQNDEKHARDYIKKLLGRIVFLHFLQKKGWMGCSPDVSEWKDGDRNFMFNYFQKAEKKSQFHSDYLVPLFFNALNKPDRKDSIFDLTGTRIPYLNGGLFEEDPVLYQTMDFPESYFENLLDFFNQYNFTIDENDPNEHEVGIDPEMLGHIFENLLEDNKDKGAYYTPKPVVQYMCLESLIQYVKTGFEKKGITLSEDDQETLERFFWKNDKGEERDKNNFIWKNAKAIEELLDEVKICDPAIGSGAFPMGLLQAIFQAKMTLDWTLDPAKEKLKIIENSIYGVDIDIGAIDIARLRFWLSIVVDDEEPRPLPNLDYKIMQGNSLLESFEGIDLKFEANTLEIREYEPQEPERNLFGEVLNPQVSFKEFLTSKSGTKETDFSLLKDGIFNIHDVEEKREIRKRINEFEQEFILEQLEKEEKKQLELKEKLETDYNISKKRFGNENTSRKTREYKELQKVEKKLAEIKTSKAKVLEITPDNKPYFLWHLYFKEVFDNGGFDILIANPPYIRVQFLSHKLIDLYKKTWMTAWKRIDLSTLFIEFGFSILNKTGNLCYISSNQFLSTEYGMKMREFLLQNDALERVIDFSDLSIFENALTYVSVFILSQRKTSYFKYYKVPQLPFSYPRSFENIDISNLSNDPWTLGKNEKLLFIKKLKENQNLITYARCWAGVFSGFDRLLMFENEEEVEHIEKDLLIPVVRAQDCQRYRFVKPSKKTFYPYIEKDEDTVLIDLETMKKSYPLAYSFIKENENTLKNRKDSRKLMGSKIGWYGLIRFGKRSRFKKEKIVSPGEVKKNSFALDLTGSAFSCARVFSITIESNELDIMFLLGLLNSKLIQFYLHNTASLKQGGYYTYSSSIINSIPIKLSDTIMKNISNYVETILLKKDNDSEANTTALEQEIDQLVYKLYSLTENEIRIVEEN